jgi:hypothetical protein
MPGRLVSLGKCQYFYTRASSSFMVSQYQSSEFRKERKNPIRFSPRVVLLGRLGRNPKPPQPPPHLPLLAPRRRRLSSVGKARRRPAAAELFLLARRRRGLASDASRLEAWRRGRRGPARLDGGLLGGALLAWQGWLAGCWAADWAAGRRDGLAQGWIWARSGPAGYARGVQRCRLCSRICCRGGD